MMKEMEEPGTNSPGGTLQGNHRLLCSQRVWPLELPVLGVHMQPVGQMWVPGHSWLTAAVGRTP